MWLRERLVENTGIINAGLNGMKTRLNWPQISDNWIVWLPVLIVWSDETVRERVRWDREWPQLSDNWNVWLPGPIVHPDQTVKERESQIRQWEREHESEGEINILGKKY